MGEVNPILVILQIGTAVIVLVIGFILNGMRDTMTRFGSDLKQLNDAVLGKYATRDELKDLAESIHKLRNSVNEQNLSLIVIKTQIEDGAANAVAAAALKAANKAQSK